jgi:SPP1 family predicted phage head-tail adaptor
MRAGDLDRKITFQKKTPTQNDFGEEEMTWATYAKVWAKQVPQGGNEAVQVGHEVGQLPVKFRVRYRNDFNEEMRIIFDAKIFDITAINEIGRREGLTILAKAYLE